MSQTRDCGGGGVSVLKTLAEWAKLWSHVNVQSCCCCKDCVTCAQATAAAGMHCSNL